MDKNGKCLKFTSPAAMAASRTENCFDTFLLIGRHSFGKQTCEISEKMIYSMRSRRRGCHMEFTAGIR